MSLPRFSASLLLLLLLAVPSRAQLPAQPVVPEVQIEQKLDEQAPLDVTFRDEEGQVRALQEYFQGKPVILVLAYYRCPRICSLVLNGVADVLGRVDYELGKDYEVVTVSIDPREKPDLARAKKRAYVEEFGLPGADQGWHFLTGDEPEIQRLADAVGFRYFYEADKDEYAHASGIMVLTPEGKVSRYFYGMTYQTRDLNYGLEDASENRIGSALTRPLRLLCFTYDPSRGQYTLMIMRLVQAGGILTVLGMVGAIGFSVYRERRRKQTPPAVKAE